MQPLIFDDGCMDFNGFSCSGGCPEHLKPIKTALKNYIEKTGANKPRKTENCVQNLFLVDPGGGKRTKVFRSFVVPGGPGG